MKQRVGIVLLCGLGWSLQSCHTTKRTGDAGTKTTVPQVSVPAEGASSFNGTAVSGVTLLATYRGHKRPLQYAVYDIDTTQIAAFFSPFRTQPDMRSPFVLSLPAPQHPLSFMVKDAGVLSEPLRRKYPNLYNLSGNTADMLGHIRLNYDGQYMSAMITYQNKTYLLSPWESTDGMAYYIIYDKNDAAESKVPFEQGEQR